MTPTTLHHPHAHRALGGIRLILLYLAIVLVAAYLAESYLR